jgi:membrane fusion protein (multidrug efflux system)
MTRPSAVFTRLVSVVVVLLVLGIAVRFAVAHWPSGKDSHKRPPTAVAMAVVSPHDFPLQVEVLGTLEGVESAPLSTPSAERIDRVLVQSGQRVTRGQPLVVLSTSEEVADTAVDRAALTAAEQDFKRASELVAKGIYPAMRLDGARAARDAAAARVRAGQARGADRVIRAPFDGVIGLVSISAGALARPGEVLLTVDQVETLRADLNFAERDVSVLTTGATVRGFVEAWPDRTFTGTLQTVSSRVDPATGQIAARVMFDNADGALRPGMVVRATLTHGTATALAVPEEAVQYEGDRTYVYIIADARKGLTAERRDVTLGQRGGNWAAVVSGVTAGERVVAAGLNRIRPGDAVRLDGPQKKGKP